MSCPVYVAIREDGITLDTGDYDEFQRWISDGCVDWYCVDDFGTVGGEAEEDPS